MKMRTEQEMMDLIIGTAKADERIRAVYMNGSRTNPNVKKDDYRDYDVVYVVTETMSFIEDKNWVLTFGNPLIIQEPDWNDSYAGYSGVRHDFSRRYAWLMLFDDRNRIDLGIELAEETLKGFLDDKLTVILLDKDGLLPEISEPSDIDYHIQKPTENGYLARCNNFWWCLNNVAKGIARDELSYVMNMLNEVVRAELHDMMNWFIGTTHGFCLSTGKNGKYFKKYLPPELYEQYAATYSGSSYDAVWEAVFTMCDLFHTLATAVAARFGFIYRQNEEDGMCEYLRIVREKSIVITHYDALVDENNDPVHDPEPLKVYMDKWDGAAFIEALELAPDKSVLEIGVGTGRLAARICGKCEILTGIDISPKTIERAKENLRDFSNVHNVHNIQLICGDFLDYSFAETFDVIYSSLTFMHIKDKRAAIQKAAALLNFGGRFVLSIDKSKQTTLEFNERRIKIYPDTPDEIVLLLTESGLNIETRFETEFAVIFVVSKYSQLKRV